MFIDYLTIIMINLVAGTVILAYYIYKGIDMEDQRSFAAGFGIVGLLGVILGLGLTFTWPLPGAYNIAFGEATTLFGAVFLATAFAIYHRWNLTPVIIFSFFAGVYAVVVGVRIIDLGITMEPLFSGIGFIMAGLGGVAAPIALPLAKKYKFVRLAIAVFLLLTALIWAFTFYNALWGHMEGFKDWLPPTLKG